MERAKASRAVSVCGGLSSASNSLTVLSFYHEVMMSPAG